MSLPPYKAPVEPLVLTTIARPGRLVPVALALLLALISTPIVMALLPAFDASLRNLQSNSPKADPFSAGVIAASLTSVLLAALVAGAMWGPTVIRHRWIGGIAATVTAWVVAIAALPVAPALLLTLVAGVVLWGAILRRMAGDGERTPPRSATLIE